MEHKILFFLALVFILLPSAALAQTTGQVDFTNTVPDIANTQAGGAVGWVQNFYQFSLIAGVFLAVGVIVWAGLRYALAAGNPSGQSDAGDQILQALLGLILLFGAYLILYTINPNLINLSLPTLSNVNVPMPVGGGGGMGTGTGGGWGTGGNYDGGAGGTSGGAGASSCFNCLTDAQVRQSFGQNGVQIKTGAGAARVEGLQQSIVNAVLELKSNCPSCEIVVTEGTGGRHQPGTYSHANGYKVDIRPNDTLDRYLEKSENFVGVRSDGAPMYRGPGGAIYAKEHNHWDVVKS
ncbi:MAG: hypothetical protein Q8Q17_01820 [bacterium]|nr:hypothetical protein [bacterium]